MRARLAGVVACGGSTACHSDVGSVAPRHHCEQVASDCPCGRECVPDQTDTASAAPSTDNGMVPRERSSDKPLSP